MELQDRPGMCTFDQAHRVIAIKDTLLWLLRKRREELVGTPLLEAYPDARPLDDILTGGQHTLAPHKARHFSSIIQRWVELEVHPTGETLQVGFSPILD